MKRYFSLILCLIVFLTLIGCTGNTTIMEIHSFDSPVEIIRDDFKVKGKFKFVHPDEMSLIITEPAEIQGISLSYLNGKTIISSEDLTVDVDSVSLGNDLFTPLFEALKVICTSGGIQIAKTGVNEVNLPSYGINLTFSSDEMKIISLEKDSVIYNFI